MSTLNEFETLDFIGKVNLLEKVNIEKNISDVPYLFEILSNQDLDPSIESMVSSSLKDLLLTNEKVTVGGLSHDSLKVRKICMRVVGEKKYLTGVKILISLITDRSDNNSMLADILFTLSEFRTPELLPVFKQFVGHRNSVVSTLAISMIGIFKDIDSVDLLCEIIEKGECYNNFLKCELEIGAAVESLVQIPVDKSLSFLVSKLYYKNLTGRYYIHRELVKTGETVIPYIEKVLNTSDVDTQIVACNVIGQIGSRKGASVLAHLYDNNPSLHPNVLYALYEALGEIPSMKSAVLLIDGLDSKSSLIVTVSVSGLEKQLKPGILDKINEILLEDSEQSADVANAIIVSRSMRIFKELYKNSQISSKLLRCIIDSNDSELRTYFSMYLKNIGSEAAIKDADAIESKCLFEKKNRVLVVDDSQTVLDYYKRILNDMNFDVTTAENGLAAINILETSHDKFDVIVTDMNMPVMNGIELIARLRSHNTFHNIPIIMITTESKKSQLKLAEDAGVDDCLKKPFNPEILESKIHKLMKA